ncbi:MAG: hypothetical protein H7832_08585 [Magnetococcus sp. DMHC-6]
MRLRNGSATGVLRHMEVVKYQSHAHGQLPHLLSHVGDAFGFDGSDGETAQPGDIGGAVTFADSRTIFVEIPVKDVIKIGVPFPYDLWERGGAILLGYVN